MKTLSCVDLEVAAFWENQKVFRALQEIRQIASLIHEFWPHLRENTVCIFVKGITSGEKKKQNMEKGKIN